VKRLAQPADAKSFVAAYPATPAEFMEFYELLLKASRPADGIGGAITRGKAMCHDHFTRLE
jgi:hypothetical protein